MNIWSLMKMAAALIATASSAFSQSADLAPDPTSLERLSVSPDIDVVIVGEVHDNPVHHVNQAKVTHDINPKAIVFEMLSDAQALKIRPDMLEDQDTLETVLNWADSGWPEFAMYYPIFAAAQDALIFGGALKRDLVRQAVTDGAAQVFGSSAVLFGLDLTLDDHVQSEREAGQMVAHCNALPISTLHGMVEAQRLRDAALARAILAAYEDSSGPVLVIAGNGHARADWGVPKLLELAAPHLNVWTIAQFEAAPNEAKVIPFDNWIVTSSVERTDPCLAFQKD